MSKTAASKLNQILSDIHSHSINLSTREIYVHGHYGDHDEEEPGVEYRMATTFIKNLHLLENENNDNILVHMHTVGGEWNDGMAMYNAIEFSSSYITILAHAHARSMSSIILQAADCRVLTSDADFMIHYGSGGTIDHVLNVISEAEWEKRITKRMFDIYATRCINGPYFKSRYKSITKDKVISFLQRKVKDHHDWWLTAEEAVYYGFADAILGTKGYENMNKLKG